MRTFHAPTYGPPSVLQLIDAPIPTPKPGEVRVRIHAASLNAADWHLLRADPFPVRFMFGLTRPSKMKGPGGDMAGVVDALGEGVTRWKVGDAVIADLFKSNFGGCADYTCLPADHLAPKPGNLSFEEAATLPLAGGTAVAALRELGQVQAGQQVLLYGASGGVGIFAIQIAKALGARVTAVCSAGKAAQARDLGADVVLDYAKDDFAAAGPYDLIVALNGYQPLRRYRDALKPGGRYLMVGGKGKQMAEAMFLGPLLGNQGRKLSYVDTKPTTERLEYLSALAEAGKLKTIIDRVYPLEQTPQALEHLEEGHAAGKIVVKVV